MGQQGGMTMQGNIIQQQGMMNPGMMGQPQLMAAGGNMVRMPAQGQYMRMQGGVQQQQQQQQQQQRMMHNPGLKQILQQQQPGPMLTGIQGQVMQQQNPGMQQANMQVAQQAGMQVQGMPTGMMMQQQRMGQGGMMQQQQQHIQVQHQQPDPLRDLLD